MESAGVDEFLQDGVLDIGFALYEFLKLALVEVFDDRALLVDRLDEVWVVVEGLEVVFRRRVDQRGDDIVLRDGPEEN